MKPEDVKVAQGLIGWIFIRTRPDISFAVSLLAQNIAQSPRQASQYALGVIEFLGGSKDLGLCYSPMETQDSMIPFRSRDRYRASRRPSMWSRHSK